MKYKLIILISIILSFMCGCKNNKQIIQNIKHTDSFEGLKSSTLNNISDNNIPKTLDELAEDNKINDLSELSNEEKQEYVDEVKTVETPDNTNDFIFYRDESLITIDDLPDNLKDNIIFNLIDEKDACDCYAAALKYFDNNVESMEISDWLTTTIYEDSYVEIFKINGKHYKFILKYDNSAIYITEDI